MDPASHASQLGAPSGAPSGPQPLQVAPWVQVSRVNQFDACKMDESTTSMLKDQLKKVFIMKPEFFSQYEPELTAFLQVCIWKFSIWVDKPTPGNASMNLRYRDERAFQALVSSGKVRTGVEGPGLTLLQKIGYLITMVGVPYGWARLQNVPTFQHSGDIQQNSGAWWLLKKSEVLYKTAQLINFLSFINTGGYWSLADRILKARLVHQSPNIVRTVTSELMNRQLVWNELSELLLLLLPILHVANLKKVLTWPIFNVPPVDVTIRRDSCPICEANPITVPYIALPCKHLFCYYCLRTRCTAHRSFRCTICGEKVLRMQQHSRRLLP